MHTPFHGSALRNSVSKDKLFKQVEMLNVLQWFRKTRTMQLRDTKPTRNFNRGTGNYTSIYRYIQPISSKVKTSLFLRFVATTYWDFHKFGLCKGLVDRNWYFFRKRINVVLAKFWNSLWINEHNFLHPTSMIDPLSMWVKTMCPQSLTSCFIISTTLCNVWFTSSLAFTNSTYYRAICMDSFKCIE